MVGWVLVWWFGSWVVGWWEKGRCRTGRLERPSQRLPVDGGGDAQAGETGAEFLVGLAMAVEDVGQVSRMAADAPRYGRNSAVTQLQSECRTLFLFPLRRHLVLASVIRFCYQFSWLVINHEPDITIKPSIVKQENCYEFNFC